MNTGHGLGSGEWSLPRRGVHARQSNALRKEAWLEKEALQAVSCSSSSSHHSSNKENVNESNVINQMMKDDEGTLKKFK